MPKLRPIFLSILTVWALGLAFSQHAWAQNVGSTHQAPKQQAAEDHLRLGVDFYLTEDLDSAIQEFQEAQQQWPEYANAYWNLGVGFAKLGNLEGAVAEWTQAERIDPSILPTRFNISALVSYNYGIALLKRGDLSSAIAEWEQALRIQPDFSEGHYALGLAYRITHNSILSQRHFAQAVYWSPDWPEARNQLAMAYDQNGEYDKALASLKHAIQVRPDHAKAYSNLGLLYLAKHNLNDAEKALTRAVNFDPQLPQARFNLGLVYAEKGDWYRAVDQIKRTIHLRPRFAEAHALFGAALSYLGDWPRAIQEWKISFSLNPKSAFAPDLHYNIGMAHRLANAPTKALKAFHRTIQLLPSSANAHFQLGAVFETLEDWEKASEHYLTAIRHRPNWALPYYKLGMIRYNQGLLDAAIESYRRAVTVQPDYAEAQYHLGVTLRAASRSQESLSHIRFAAELGMKEAQSMLGTMYANGSGTERDLVQAMRWWFRAAYALPYEDADTVAQSHLSKLRAWMFTHQNDPNYIRRVREGFKAIQTDIQQRFEKGHRSSKTSSVGIQLDRSGRREESIPILLQEALALNVEAHDYLKYLFTHEEVGPYRPRVLEYFSQTAKEGSRQSCQFLKTLSAQHILSHVELISHNSKSCFL